MRSLVSSARDLLQRRQERFVLLPSAHHSQLSHQFLPSNRQPLSNHQSLLSSRRSSPSCPCPLSHPSLASPSPLLVPSNPTVRRRQTVSLNQLPALSLRSQQRHPSRHSQLRPPTFVLRHHSHSSCRLPQQSQPIRLKASPPRRPTSFTKMSLPLPNRRARLDKMPPPLPRSRILFDKMSLLRKRRLLLDRTFPSLPRSQSPLAQVLPLLRKGMQEVLNLVYSTYPLLHRYSRPQKVSRVLFRKRTLSQSLNCRLQSPLPQQL